MSTDTGLNGEDIAVLRALARRKLEAARDPSNAERRDAWHRLDAGGPCRPMVLAEVAGVKDKTQPLRDEAMQCRDPWARGLEYRLRMELYNFEALRDDHVVEPVWTLPWKVSISDYGVPVVQHRAEGYEGMGSRSWDPPVRDLDRDFARLRPRTFSVDRDATLAEKARLEAVFAGLLPVEIRGAFWWTLGLTWKAIDLIGLENLMLQMYDNPAGLHRLMAFLRADHIALARGLEREGLLTLNNRNDYIGSGSMGYTRDLPRPDAAPDRPARMQDLWALSESQETVGVGPEQFAEFIFPYQKAITDLFGKIYYGCCEPVHNRFHVIRQMPNLARVSVSPWADEAFMARELGRRYVYSRKPNPTLISTERFDEDAIRADLRKTLETAGGCRLEIVMKDVHTLNNQPGRLARWVELARAAIAEAGFAAPGD